MSSPISSPAEPPLDPTALDPTAPGHASLEQRIHALAPWFHNMNLGGVQTAPDHFLFDYPAVKFRHIQQFLPADMSGMSVLDIGCNAGFYALEMKRRGASRVLGIDTDPRYLAQARLASDVTGLPLDLARMSVWEIASLRERFDLVLFLGVLYHLRHPLLALDLIHEYVAKDKLLFQSLQRGSRAIAPVAEDYDFAAVEHFNAPGYPRLHFIEHRYAHDETNWWAPNQACVEAMLRSSGFDIVARPEDETYLCQWRPIVSPPDGPHVVHPPRA